ncbi:MAG: DNA polymerase III subunit gamma/tau [Candidatus Obscuribacterales bacterium]
MLQTYQPLYLKYRPQSLADLVGQKSVAQTLTNAIDHSRISHAYLFTGPRGTGKTSSARILAKSLNCEAGPTATPCLTCASCLEIKAGNSPSVFELDAASNNSVDDARSLIERAPLVAQGGRYKLYIIDECHMLTKEAFNALLKTIEEPPPMVVFILATTEEHKVPPTIISRCQRLMFKLVNQKELVAHLRHISTLEEINILDEALELIARRSGGGLRDALGLLDQASLLSTKEKPVEVNDLLLLLGAVHEDILLQISTAVQNRDGQAVLAAANTLLMEGREPAILVLELAKHFLNLTKASYVNETGSLTAESLNTLVLGSPSYLQALVSQAKNFDRAELALMVEYLDKLEQTCRRSSQPVLSVEMGLLSLCHRHDMTFVRDLDARVKTLESVMADDIARGPVAGVARPAAPATSNAGPTSHAAPPSTPRPNVGTHAAVPSHTQPRTESAPAHVQSDHRPSPSHTPAAAHAPAMGTHAHGAAADARPTHQSSTPKAVPGKSERHTENSAPVEKAPAPTTTVSNKINEMMAAAGFGAPSTSSFKSGSGSSSSSSSSGDKARSSGFPAPAAKVPMEAPPGDSSYDDVEPEEQTRIATPVIRPPVEEPSLEVLEAQGDVIAEIDDYDILPKPISAPAQEPLPLAAPPINTPPASASEDEEEEEEEEEEAPIESDDYDDGIPPAPLVVEDPALKSQAAAAQPTLNQTAPSAPAATQSAAAAAPSAPATSSAPSATPPSGGEDIDQFWSEVKENLQKRHLPTFSIVSVHAFPVALDNGDLVLGVRKEYFQKQLETKIDHLKAACAAASGRTMNVRIKVIADNAPAPAAASKAPAARPKETRSAPADSEEGESRAPNSPPAANQSTAQSSSNARQPEGQSPVRTSHSSHIESRVGGNLINEAYKLFEGPGSRLIG